MRTTAIDTTIPSSVPHFAACSSSLVSLHMAFNALLLGNTSRATNSGANLMLSGAHCSAATQAAAVFQNRGIKCC